MTLEPLVVVLLLLLVVSAMLVAFVADLFAAVMLTGIFSLLVAALFVVLGAPDVAFTEAAVGGGVSTVLFLITIAATKSIAVARLRFSPPALATCLATGALLVYASLDMPIFGSATSPARLHVAEYYLANTPTDIGVPNVVTAILASYRGIDTLGELAVIFTAGMGVYALLRVPRRLPEDTQK